MSMANDDKPKWLDPIGAFVLLCLTVMFCVVTIGPYFGLHPDVDDANQKAVVNNLFIAVVSFFVGGSVQNRKKDEVIATSVNTAAKAQDALAPLKAAEEIKP